MLLCDLLSSSLKQVTKRSAMAAVFVLAVSSAWAQNTTQQYSSSVVPVNLMADAADAAPGPSSAAATQYGRTPGTYPQYRSRWSRIAFEAGGGFNGPIGNDTPYLTWGGNLSVGAGWNFTNRIGVLAEYQFIDDKLPGNYIATWVGSDGGNAHIWSLTLAPILYWRPNNAHGFNAYMTGGGGFYRKVNNFTNPAYEEICDIFGDCGVISENETVYHFSSNQGGLNLGLGLTHSLGERAKLFAEARYLWIDSPNEFPEKPPTGSTAVIPVTFGVRW